MHMKMRELEGHIVKLKNELIEHQQTKIVMKEQVKGQIIYSVNNTVNNIKN